MAKFSLEIYFNTAGHSFGVVQPQTRVTIATTLSPWQQCILGIHGNFTHHLCEVCYHSNHAGPLATIYDDTCISAKNRSYLTAKSPETDVSVEWARPLLACFSIRPHLQHTKMFVSTSSFHFFNKKWVLGAGGGP